jgi:heptosyltransferase I
MIKSICLVRLSALGDVLMCVPLVRTIQRYLPNVALTWIISEPAHTLVQGMEGVEFIVIEKPKVLRDYWQFKQKINNRVFDVLLAAQASFRANLLYPCIRAHRKIGYDKIRAKDAHGWFVHETITPGHDHTLDGFLKFAQAIGIQHSEIRWDLPIPQDAIDWARSHVPHTPFFLVNPAASKPERSWLVSRYIEVIRFVQETYNMPVVLTGGPGAYDKTLGEAISAEVSVINLIGQTKPKQLLAVIQQAFLALCPDTGPSHMAGAVGTPVIALHAVTPVEVSGPYPFRQYAVNHYPEAVVRVLKKTLETCPWGMHAHGDDTMQLITVDDVISKIQSVMSLLLH